MNRVRETGKSKNAIAIKQIEVPKVKRTYNKKKKKVDQTKSIINFLDQGNLFNIFRRYVSTVTHAVCSPTCGADCKQRFFFLESMLLENHLIPNPYYQLYGCFKHGYYVNRSILFTVEDKERFQNYIMEFKKILSYSNIVASPTDACDCELQDLPHYFYNANIMKWQPRPFYICRDHNTVHYCRQTIEKCQRCYCCAAKKPCLFQCHYVKKQDKDGSHICLVSKFIFVVSKTVEEECEEQDAYVRSTGYGLTNNSTMNIEEKILSNIDSALQGWIDMKSKTPYTEPLTVQSHFTAYLDEYLFATIIKENMQKKYFYPGVAHFISILRNINIKNFQNIEWIPNFKEECLRLWKTFLYYFPFLLASEYALSMIFHLQAQNGLSLENFVTLPLNQKYYPMMCYLIVLKIPIVTKSNNISKFNQDLCKHLKDLSIEKQEKFLQTIMKDKIQLFNFSSFHIKKK